MRLSPLRLSPLRLSPLRLSPSGLNTLRIITQLNHKNEVEKLGVTLRI